MHLHWFYRPHSVSPRGHVQAVGADVGPCVQEHRSLPVDFQGFGQGVNVELLPDLGLSDVLGHEPVEGEVVEADSEAGLKEVEILNVPALLCTSYDTFSFGISLHSLLA